LGEQSVKKVKGSTYIAQSHVYGVSPAVYAITQSDAMLYLSSIIGERAAP